MVQWHLLKPGSGLPCGGFFGGMAPFGPLYFHQRTPRRKGRNLLAEPIAVLSKDH
jgi:hypothetical protein